MGSNSFGRHFSITTFGESHGEAVGCIVDGCPSGVLWDQELLVRNLQRRRPGKHGQKLNLQSDRAETDVPMLLSGVFEEKTLGTPIALTTKNINQRSEDYAKIKNQARPGHADDTWKNKFQHTDHRGGGRSSARETLARVMGASVAQMFLQQSLPNYKIKAYVSQVFDLEISESEKSEITKFSGSQKEWFSFLDDSFTARFPSLENKEEVQKLLLEAKEEGKSYGGFIDVIVEGVPDSLGQAVFHKLKADLAGAMLGIPASNSFSLGYSLNVNRKEGSLLHKMDDPHGELYGGIRGGFSTGENLNFRIGFKPTSSVLDTAKSGRHDPCILPRAVPVVEAMTHLVIADHLLWKRLDLA